MSDDVSIIDEYNGTVVKTISVGSGPVGISVNPNTNKIYVSNYGDGTINVLGYKQNLPEPVSKFEFLIFLPLP